MGRNKKNKEEYLKKKRLKQEAKKKESEHKIDYSSIPDKSYDSGMPMDDLTGHMELAMLMGMMLRRKMR